MTQTIQIKADEKLFMRFQQLEKQCKTFKSIIQNDMEIDKDDLLRWHCYIDKFVADLYVLERDVDCHILGLKATDYPIGYERKEHSNGK